MKTVNVIIESESDESVGIFSQQWELKDIQIYDEDRDIFVEQLVCAFNTIGENVFVFFSDEYLQSEWCEKNGY